MNTEKSLIKMINSIMPSSPLQHNKLFESDSEIVEFGGGKLLFSMDEFSSEDRLRENDPYTLGWNLAVGAISDIYASGGNPVFYSHSMAISEKWDDEYIKSFSRGVAEVLKVTGTAFIGGDFGRAGEWRYTAAVIGRLEGSPVLRSGAKVGDGIYITGRIGAGNLEAFLSMYKGKSSSGKLPDILTGMITGAVKNQFISRHREAEFVRKYASACIDTSDGVFNSINIISEMSGTGYELRGLPYIKAGSLAAKALNIPVTLLFLGECGEYELLFTVAPDKEEAFLIEAEYRELNFFKIGKVMESPLRLLQEGGRKYDLGGLNVSARDFPDLKEYIKLLIKFLNTGVSNSCELRHE